MSKQIYISDEAFEYLQKVQQDFLVKDKVKVSLAALASRALLNNVKGEQ
jgi:hypothetical protein